MTDREKLIEMINHISEGHIANLMQPGGAEELADHLLSHGVTVREKQKPLTVEEAQSIWPRIVFVEKRGMEMTPFPVALVQVRYKGNFRALEFGRKWQLLLPVEDYGRMYRLWDGLPTEEERMATEWEK